MTAHVLLPAFDDRRPASISPVIMGEVIRDRIGLTGLVMSDDLGMKALGGPFAERARDVIAAGCDVALHCSGKLAEMVEVAGAVPPLDGIAAERFDAARAPACTSRNPSMSPRQLALVDGGRRHQVAAMVAEPSGAGMTATRRPMTKTRKSATTSSDWESDGRDAMPTPGETLVVDVEGFEGPLDLLLALARTQKVDLAKISVLALAQQYLDFIAEARRLRLEIAADYLVMAAWLAFLKSKLLLPAEPGEEGEPTGDELAALLAFRLKRLHAMREASAQLMTRKRLGRDVFARGDAGADPRHAQERLRGQCLRSAQGLFAAAAAHGDAHAADAAAHGLVAEGSARASLSGCSA